MSAPITRKINAAIDKLQRAGIRPTIDRVEVNVGWRSFIIEEMEQLARAALREKIARVMKSRQLIIGDEETRERFDLWAATGVEIEVQWQIKRDNRQYVEAHEKAQRMVLDLLKAKERDLGYPPVAALYYDDIRRIYAMQGLEPPK